MIFGGGRNTDFEAETTTEFANTQRIQHDLTDKLHQLILPNQKAEIESCWAGIMAFGNVKQPIVKAHTKNIVLGVRMGGMGVAIGSQVGEEVANLMTKKA